MLLAEELLLLCTDDVSGKKTVSGDQLDAALGGAMLTELVLAGRIGIVGPQAGWSERGRIMIISAESTGDEILDGALRITAELAGRKAKDVLGGMGSSKLTKGLRDALLARVVAGGVLTREDQRVLGLFSTTAFPEADPVPERDVRQRLWGALTGARAPDPRTAALIALLHAIRRTGSLFTGVDRRDIEARAKAIAEGHLVSDAVKQSIDEVAAVMTAVVVSTTVITTT